MRQGVKAAACVLGLTAAVTPVWADAIVERYQKSGGVAGMGAFEGTSLTVTSATAQREESSMTFTGAFLGALQRVAGAGDTIRITRLDRGVVWSLEPKEKTYTEAPLERFTAEERRRLRQGSGGRGQQEDSNTVVTRQEFKVEKTGAKKTINGFPCEEYVMTWLVETRDKQTGETGKSVMTNRMWTTPETAAIREAEAQEQAYAQAYAKKIGLEMSPQEAQMFLAGLTGLSAEDQQKALQRVSAEMAKVKGYTIASQIEWQLEGSGGAGTGAGGQAAPKEVQEMMKGLGKLFGGGQKSGGGEGAGGKEPGGKEPSSDALVTFYTEVKSIRAMPFDSNRYEVPAGYTRK